MFKDIAGILVVAFALIVIILGIVFSIAFPLENAACKSKAVVLQAEGVSWGILQGCAVKLKGKWYLLDKSGWVQVRPQN